VQAGGNRRAFISTQWCITKFAPLAGTTIFESKWKEGARHEIAYTGKNYRQEPSSELDAEYPRLVHFFGGQLLGGDPMLPNFCLRGCAPDLQKRSLVVLMTLARALLATWQVFFFEHYDRRCNR